MFSLCFGGFLYARLDSISLFSFSKLSAVCVYVCNWPSDGLSLNEQIHNAASSNTVNMSPSDRKQCLPQGEPQVNIYDQFQCQKMDVCIPVESVLIDSLTLCTWFWEITVNQVLTGEIILQQIAWGTN